MLNEKFNDEALRTKDRVVELMSSCHSRQEWDKNCDAVIAANYGRYPAFWYEAVEATDLYSKTSKNFDH